METLTKRPRRSLHILNEKLTNEEKSVYLTLLPGEALDIDEIVEKSKLSENQVKEIISKYEKEKLVSVKYSLQEKDKDKSYSLNIDFEFKPALSKNISVSEIENLKIIVTPWQERLSLSSNEWEVITLFDGNLSLNEIFRKMIDKGILMLPHQIMNLIEKLEDVGALDNFGRTIFKPRESKIEKLFKFMEITIFQWKPSTNNFKNARRIANLFGFLYTWPAYIISLISYIFVTYYLLSSDRCINIQYIAPKWYYIALYYLVFIISLIIHEIGHFLSLLSIKGTPGFCALRLYYFINPAIVVDTSDLWSFNILMRIRVFLAGVQMQSILCFIGIFLLKVVHVDAFMNIFAKQLIIANYFTILFNLLCILIRTDGYFVLSHILKINQLQKKAFAVVFPQLGRKINVPGGKFFKAFAWTYVIGGILFNLFVLVYTVKTIIF